MRAAPARPRGGGAGRPGRPRGKGVDRAGDRGRVVTLRVRSLCSGQRERRRALRRAERYVTIGRASVPGRVIGPPGRVMCAPGLRRAEAGGPRRAPGEDHVSDDVRKGDHVTWKSHGQEVEGTVKREITSETEAGGRKVKASKDEPQYEVESDGTGRTAVHKPGALHEK